MKSNNKTKYFSEELIQSIDWHQFEKLCISAFDGRGLDIRATGSGADEGIDAIIYQDGIRACYLQVKGGYSEILVEPVRAFYGVMCADNIKRGVMIASNDFGFPAKKFAKRNGVVLLSGKNFIRKMICSLPIGVQKRLFDQIHETSLGNPSCPNCETKMTAKKNYMGELFWGCSNFPKCQRNLNYVPTA